MSKYNLIWAVAILRDDFGLTWRSIGERLNITDKTAHYLYGKRKKHYSINLGATEPRGTGTTQTVLNFSRDIGADTVSRERYAQQG
jgi:orotate phosphoribosyltransferase-like protein